MLNSDVGDESTNYLPDYSEFANGPDWYFGA